MFSMTFDDALMTDFFLTGFTVEVAILSVFCAKGRASGIWYVFLIVLLEIRDMNQLM
jgi:hypothetical protein